MSSITVCVPWMLHLLGTLLSYDLFHVFCSLERLEDEFYNCVRAMDVAATLKVEEEVVDAVYSFWLLKRKVR